jgi:hypothetical protein
MAHDVFISYSSADKAYAEAVCAGLEGRGLRCWIAPRDILPGLEWGAAIIDAITESRAMVLIFSKNTSESVQVSREIERAVAKRVAVINFRVEEAPLNKTLEYFLSTAHWYDASTRPIEPHVGRLADQLNALLSRPSRAVPTGEHRAVSSPAAVPAVPTATMQARAPTFPPTAAPLPVSPAPAARARGPQRTLLAVGAVLALSLAILLLSSGGHPPEILSLQFPPAIAAGQRGNGTIDFRDKKGDVTRARFEVVQSAGFRPFTILTEGTAGKTSGQWSFWLSSPLPEHVSLRVVLIDAAGRESKPVPLEFDVRVVLQPKPRRGFEIQAPNGMRFKVK